VSNFRCHMVGLHMKHMIFKKKLLNVGFSKATVFRASGLVFFDPVSNFICRASKQCWSLSVSLSLFC